MTLGSSKVELALDIERGGAYGLGVERGGACVSWGQLEL
jgi:hypothetical protein